MQYVIIEYFGEPALVKDDKGKVKLFSNTTDAVEEARGYQNGVVVPLSPSLMNTIAESWEYVTYSNTQFKIPDEQLEDELKCLLGHDNEEEDETND